MQIDAPAKDGEANAALLDFISSVSLIIGDFSLCPFSFLSEPVCFLSNSCFEFPF